MRDFSFRIKLEIATGLLLSSILFNPIVAGKLIAADTVITSTTLRLLLWILSIYLLITFCLFIKNPAQLIEHYLANYRNYLLLIFSMAISLVFAEFILCVRLESKKSQMYYVNNYEFNYLWRGNSLGFRDEEFVKEKDARSLRIFLLGDSFIEGIVKEEDTIDKLLEKKCKEDGLSCQVYNLGRSGRRLPAFLAVAEQMRDYHPDFVILSLYVDEIPPLQNKLDEGATNKGGFYQKIKDAINTSLVLQACDYLLARLNKYSLYPWLKRYKGPRFYRQLMLEGQMNGWLFVRCEYAAKYGGNQKLYKVLIDRFNNNPIVKKTILDIKEIYKDSGFVLLLNPSKYQTNKRYFAELRKAGFTCIDDQTADREIQDEIISWAKQENIAYLDLLPAVIERDATGPLFYNLDIHFNAQGNRLAAEEIYKKLKDMGVLKK